MSPRPIDDRRAGGLPAGIPWAAALALAAAVLCGAAAAWTAEKPPAAAAAPAAPAAAAAPAGKPDWRESFAAEGTVESAGEYRGGAGAAWKLESFSPLSLEASPTGTFKISREGQAGVLRFADSQAALQPNPYPPPEHTKTDGSISAMGWVERHFGDLRLAGDVNAGAAGASASRQGLMARWDLGNNFYWLYVNFATGRFGIMRSRYFGVMGDLEGSSAAIRGFDAAKSYRLELEARGDTFNARVYERAPDGPRLVGEVGPVKDPEPQRTGVSGFLAEVAMEKPHVPLSGSFANIESIALDGGVGAKW